MSPVRKANAVVPINRRERNKARIRTAILDAALACFAEGGVQATTMDQIAATADVARATLFNYFPGKADIVDSLIEENDAGFYLAMAGWRSLAALTTAQRLLGLFAATAHYLRRAPAHKRALVGLSWMNWTEAGSLARIRRVTEEFARMLDEGQAAGDVRPGLDTAVAAEIICNAYMGIIHNWRLDDAYPTPERMDAAARMLGCLIAPGEKLPDRAPSPPLPRSPD